VGWPRTQINHIQAHISLYHFIAAAAAVAWCVLSVLLAVPLTAGQTPAHPTLHRHLAARAEPEEAPFIHDTLRYGVSSSSSSRRKLQQVQVSSYGGPVQVVYANQPKGDNMVLPRCESMLRQVSLQAGVQPVNLPVCLTTSTIRYITARAAISAG
jgi:hypothetical protein